MIENIIGCRLKAEKNKNQRRKCGCMESVSKNFNKYDSDSPILCGILAEDDKITERKVKSLKEKQLSMKHHIRGKRKGCNNRKLCYGGSLLDNWKTNT